MYAATHLIPEDNLAPLQDKLGKLNARAARLGLPAVAVTPVKRVLRPQGKHGMLAYWWVTIVGDAPRFDGWRFVARYDWEQAADGGELCFTNAVPGETIPPERRDATRMCDHCGAARRRTNTFLLAHPEHGYKVVGRNCLADFLGRNMTGIVAGFEWLRELADEVEEWGKMPSGHVTTYYPLEDVLAQTAAITRQLGYRSAAAVVDGGTSTGATVSWLLGDAPRDAQTRKEWEAARERFAPQDGDKAKARQVLAWIGLQDAANSDWLANLKKLVALGHCPERRVTLLASAIVGLDRELARRAERAQKLNEHAGTPGKREHFDVKVTHTASFFSGYGQGTRVVMEDAAGRTMVWFATGRVSVEIGWAGRILATVKAHDEYKGTKQTLLSRVSGLGD